MLVIGLLARRRPCRDRSAGSGFRHPAQSMLRAIVRRGQHAILMLVACAALINVHWSARGPVVRHSPKAGFPCIRRNSRYSGRWS